MRKQNKFDLYKALYAKNEDREAFDVLPIYKSDSLVSLVSMNNEEKIRIPVSDFLEFYTIKSNGIWWKQNDDGIMENLSKFA